MDGKHLCPKCGLWERCSYEQCMGTCNQCAMCTMLELGYSKGKAIYFFGWMMIPPLTPNMFDKMEADVHG